MGGETGARAGRVGGRVGENVEMAENHGWGWAKLFYKRWACVPTEKVGADKPAVRFWMLGLGVGSGQVRADGGRGSADFDAGGGDSAHRAVDTAGEEGHEREAAEIEARGGGETC